MRAERVKFYTRNIQKRNNKNKNKHQSLGLFNISHTESHLTKTVVWLQPLKPTQGYQEPTTSNSILYAGFGFQNLSPVAA